MNLTEFSKHTMSHHTSDSCMYDFIIQNRMTSRLSMFRVAKNRPTNSFMNYI